MSSRKSRARMPLALVVLTLCACAEPPSGTVAAVDSAGVPLVRNPASADWGASPPVVEEELRIGSLDGATEEQFGQVAGVDVDGEGRIYVLDRQAAMVRMFDASGRYVRTLGRPGGGPGELGSFAMAVLVGAGDTVYVVDVGQRRIQPFASDAPGTGASALAPRPLRAGSAWAITPEGDLLSWVRAPGMALPGAQTQPVEWVLRQRRGSESIDTVLEFEATEPAQTVGVAPRLRLFAPQTRWAMLTDGRMVYGRTDEYRLVITNPDGEVERVVTSAVPAVEVTDAVREEYRSQMSEAMAKARVPEGLTDPAMRRQVGDMVRQMADNLEFADHYPLFSSLFGGPDGSVWVQRPRSAEASLTEEDADPESGGRGGLGWDVIGRDGVLRGRIELPRGFVPMRTVGNRVYGTIRDGLGIAYVARLRVAMPGS